MSVLLLVLFRLFFFRAVFSVVCNLWGPDLGPLQLIFFSYLFFNHQDRTSDYHLWVISGKDDPAYPLIGMSSPVFFKF